jgi:hypothetical protein
MDAFRPEYLDAVAAARWNGWLLPLFLAAPTILVVCFATRMKRRPIAVGLLASMFATWLSLFLYSERIWETMGNYAVTDAERREFTADTGRLFGPVLVGVPFSALYTLCWFSIIGILNWGIRALTTPKRAKRGESNVGNTDYESYRRFLVEEYSRLRDETS